MKRSLTARGRPKLTAISPKTPVDARPGLGSNIQPMWIEHPLGQAPSQALSKAQVRLTGAPHPAGEADKKAGDRDADVEEIRGAWCSVDEQGEGMWLVPWETKDKGSGKDSGLSLKEGRLGERDGISKWFSVEKENLKDLGTRKTLGTYLIMKFFGAFGT